MNQESHSPRRFRRGFEYGSDGIQNLPLGNSGSAGVVAGGGAGNDRDQLPSITLRSDEVENLLWQNFESVACSIAELYRSSEWGSFQRAASAATLLYKNSVETFQRGVDLGATVGRQLFYKEIVAWLRCSPSPFIQLKELESFLLLRAVCSSKPFVSVVNAGPGGGVVEPGSETGGVVVNAIAGGKEEHSESLHMFQEALNTPQDLNSFFEEACHRNGKRRCPPSIDDDVRRKLRRL